MYIEKLFTKAFLLFVYNIQLKKKSQSLKQLKYNYLLIVCETASAPIMQPQLWISIKQSERRSQYTYSMSIFIHQLGTTPSRLWLSSKFQFYRYMFALSWIGMTEEVHLHVCWLTLYGMRLDYWRLLGRVAKC